jgi:hypothetical protein
VGRHRHQHRALNDRRLGGLADVERDLVRTRTAEAPMIGKTLGRDTHITVTKLLVLTQDREPVEKGRVFTPWWTRALFVTRGLRSEGRPHRQ